jgi:hypothetical protein
MLIYLCSAHLRLSLLFYAVKASRKAIETFAAAKVQQFFDIYKKICILRADLLNYIFWGLLTGDNLSPIHVHL